MNKQAILRLLLIVAFAHTFPLQGESLALEWEEIRVLAFLNEDKLRRYRYEDEFEIVTNAEGLDLSALGVYLVGVQDRMEEVLPCFSDNASRISRLVIFDGFDQMKSFLHRYANRVKKQVTDIHADGFTVSGVGFSFWDSKKGHCRPVYTHEFVHSYLENRIGIPNEVAFSWLHEGIANYFQFMHFYPPEYFRSQVRAMVEQPYFYYRFSSLLSERPVRKSHYLKVLTLVAFLLDEPEGREIFCQMVGDIKKGTIEDPANFILDYYLYNWEELEEQWEQFCRRKYLASDQL